MVLEVNNIGEIRKLVAIEPDNPEQLIYHGFIEEDGVYICSALDLCFN